MPGERKLEQVKRSQRLRQIEQLLLHGMSRVEMAQTLGVNEKTIRRDLKHRYEALKEQFGDETAAYRSAILAELGRILNDAVKDAKVHREAGHHTDAYLDVRVKALRLVASLTGTHAAVKHMVLHGNVGTVTPARSVDGKLVIEYVPNGFENARDTSGLLKDCSADDLRSGDEATDS